MEIELKNGEIITLEVSPLILEYVEEYEGGQKQLEKDAQGQLDSNGYSRRMRATNHLIYSAIASNYSSNLTYRQAVKLVKLEDIEKILTFIAQNVPGLENVNKGPASHRM